MTREKMLEIQGIRSRPKRFFTLNRKGLKDRAVESLCKLALATGADPLTASHPHMAPLNKQEKADARSEAAAVVAEVRKDIEAKKEKVA